MSKIYTAKSSKLLVRDFGPEFKGAPIRIDWLTREKALASALEQFIESKIETLIGIPMNRFEIFVACNNMWADTVLLFPELKELNLDSTPIYYSEVDDDFYIDSTSMINIVNCIANFGTKRLQ